MPDVAVCVDDWDGWNCCIDWDKVCCWNANWFEPVFSDGDEVDCSVCWNVDGCIDDMEISDDVKKGAAENFKTDASRNVDNLKIFENVEKDVNRNAEKNAENAAFDNLIRYVFITFLVASRLTKNFWRRFADNVDFHAFESMLSSMKNSHFIWFDVNFSPSWWHRRISFSVQSVQPCNVLYSVSVIEFFFFIHTPCFRSTSRSCRLFEVRLNSFFVKPSNSSRNFFHNSLFLQSNIFHSSISVTMNSEMTVAIFFIIEMTQAGRQRSVSRTMLQRERQGEKLISIMTVDSVDVVNESCRVLPANWSWSMP